MTALKGPCSAAPTLMFWECFITSYDCCSFLMITVGIVMKKHFGTCALRENEIEYSGAY